MSTPLISIIIPTYNAEKYFLCTIQSVLNQTYQNWEMIIVDDCSSDNTFELALKFTTTDSRIKVFKLEKNSGPAIARNMAIESAQGRYIAFLDSDDLWLPEKLEKQIKFMQEMDIAFSFTAYEKINEAGRPFQSFGVPQKISYPGLLKTCFIGCLTAIYDTEKLGKAYMPTNTKREDFATWLTILKKVEYAYGLQEVLAQYRVYGRQTSARKIRMAFENWYLYRHIEKLSLMQSSYYFAHYAVNGLLRTKFPGLARLLGKL